MGLTRGRDAGFYHGAVVSVASNADRTDNLFIAPAPGYIKSVNLFSTEGDQAANAGSYRSFKVINAGTGLAGTTVLASKVANVSWGSDTVQAFTVSAPTATAYHLASGQMVQLVLATVGGDNAAGKALAGVITVEFAYI